MDIENYADDNTQHTTANDIGSLIVSLEEASKFFSTWLDNNLMKSNDDKCRLLVSTKAKVKIKLGRQEIANSKHEKLSGVHLDSKLSLNYHKSEICKKASPKSLYTRQSNTTHELI